VSGSYNRWPTHSGFDKFYGFIGGETNQWAPAIIDGTTPVEPPNTPGYHFTVDMTDKAVGWMQAQHALTPDYPARGNQFTGVIQGVTIHTSAAKLTPEQKKQLEELNDGAGLSID
jgi:arylsulfatase A-like enzyme